MMQGDQYALEIAINTESGPAEGKDFLEVEIVVGDLRKTMSSGVVTYSPEKKAFLFPLTQEETFMLYGGQHPMQVRVKLLSGNVIGVQLPDIDVGKSLSREVLK